MRRVCRCLYDGDPRFEPHLLVELVCDVTAREQDEVVHFSGLGAVPSGEGKGRALPQTTTRGHTATRPYL